MNAAGYCHDLPSELGNLLETSLSYEIGIYASWLLPIYCMFKVRENNMVVDDTVAKSTVAQSRSRATVSRGREADRHSAETGHVCNARKSPTMPGAVHMFCCNKFLHAE